MFSKSCEYAIRAVLFLASFPVGELFGVEQLAEKLQVPRHFLAKILQQLSRNRLISSSKGRNGGFFLSEANRKETLIAVIECIEGPAVFTNCVLGLEKCSNANPCPYHHVVAPLRDEFHSLLKNETIEDSARRIKEQNLKLLNYERG
ncbi:MAG: Rrf2 family transcriptional regulator [Saprospiraceae bacterium]|nr:Rrf2 family transcriptional regulator [Saprospiraceae bacterium]